MSELGDLLPESIAAQDYSTQQSTIDVKALLRTASADSGRSSRSLRKEIKRCRGLPGQLSAAEYFHYRLYERDPGSHGEFISDWLHWPIHEATQDPVRSPKTVDKWACAEELVEAGIPTIPILAVVDGSGVGRYGGTPTISSTNELREFLSDAELPLFAKPNRLLGSFGAFRIDGFDGEAVTIAGGRRVPVGQLVTPLMSNTAYVLQHVVANHREIGAFSNSLATLRTVNFVRDGSVRLAAAILKIPVGDNVADNAWRPGNLVADVDLKTGIVRRVVEGLGPAMIEHSTHPLDGSPIAGIELPNWADLLALNTKTALYFGSISYQSLDIALTPSGPIVVEVNSGASFALPQQASGRGFLTGENKRFFESCGVDFDGLPGPPG